MSKYVYLTSKIYEFTSDQGKTYTGENHFVAELFNANENGFMPDPRIIKVREDVGVFKATAGDVVLIDKIVEYDSKAGADVVKLKNIRLAKK